MILAVGLIVLGLWKKQSLSYYLMAALAVATFTIGGLFMSSVLLVSGYLAAAYLISVYAIVALIVRAGFKKPLVSAKEFYLKRAKRG